MTTVDRLNVSAYRIPTATPESDGTLEWNATTLVLVQVDCAGESGLGYTYADKATAVFIEEHLRDVAIGADVMSPQAAWAGLRHVIRNLGRPGVASMAISAVDAALWDLKARVLGVPLVQLLGAKQPAVPLYGSGGFTSYTDEQLGSQLRGWVDEGIRMVKMKVGRDPTADVRRVRGAREAIGSDIELFVDANGAHSVEDAIEQGKRFAAFDVRWFEEPVSSDDLRGLATVRRALSGQMDVAAGEYGYDLPYFERLLDAGAVSVVQADVTRCAGITELLRIGALCEARGVPLSLHTAPAVHLHVACACDRVRHLEYFHDHVRIERMLFDGLPPVKEGALAPDLARPGNGLSFRTAEAARFAV